VVDTLALLEPGHWACEMQAGETFVSAVFDDMAGTEAALRPGGELAMSISVLLGVFPVIFLGELPDKTMFASLVLSTKGRPFSIWLGAAAAFVVHVAIAVSVGVALFTILPHRAVDAVVAVMFLAGAGLAIREARSQRRHRAREEHLTAFGAGHHRQAALIAFVVIFIAEWGDLTQVLTANLAARLHSPLSVAVGSVLALWAVAALAVVGGHGLLRRVKVATIRIVTAVILIGLGLATGILAIAG
jgi:putative Ca2+/H+ antiporter (TMEM165/GDT1 family)